MSRLSEFARLPLFAFALHFGILHAQPVEPPRVVPGRTTRLAEVDPTTGQLVDPPKDVGPRLDFTFDGIPLKEVIQRVQAGYQKESGKYLNVMVPEQLRDVAQTNLITLEVKQVTVAELFELLGRASQRSLLLPEGGTPPRAFARFNVGYTFERLNTSGGTLTYLLKGEYPASNPAYERTGAPQPPEASKYVQFYQLEPYLDHFTVEDITTAIKTGADLAGYKGAPTLKFHEETKLLVAYGTEAEILIIQQVLDRLDGAKRPPGLPGQPQPQSLPRPGSRPIPAQPQPALPLPPARP